MQTPAQPSPSLRFFPGVRVPKYREHVSGQARVTLSGKTYCLGKFKSPESEAEYRRVVSEWLAIGCRPAGPQPDQLTVVEVLDAYWSDLQTQEPSASKLDQARRAIGLMKTHCGTIASAADISPATLRAIQRALTDKGNIVRVLAISVEQLTEWITTWRKKDGHGRFDDMVVLRRKHQAHHETRSHLLPPLLLRTRSERRSPGTKEEIRQGGLGACRGEEVGVRLDSAQSIASNRTAQVHRSGTGTAIRQHRSPVRSTPASRSARGVKGGPRGQSTHAEGERRTTLPRIATEITFDPHAVSGWW
jgi:hypothetical protein